MHDLANKEKCGILGMTGADSALTDFQLAHEALQHRGDGMSGHVIQTKTGDVFVKHILGRISDRFGAEESVIVDPITITGHNRYATSAGTSLTNAQPFNVSADNYQLNLSHNGNVASKYVQELRKKLKKKLHKDASDSAIMSQLLIEARQQYVSWLETFTHTLPLFQGAFSLICSVEDGSILAARDPWGIRPLCIGRKGAGWMVASETVALDAVDAEYLRELLPGELVHVHPNGSFESVIYGVSKEGERRCLLEDIYFGKNGSYQHGTFVWQERRALGRAAAKRFLTKNIDIDIVIPILNSGKQMSVGAAEILKKPYLEAIGVNGVKRSFIQNTQAERRKAVHDKHIVFDPQHGETIKDKRILLCDDSVVRGNSLEGLLEKIKESQEYQPKEIHVLLSSEPVVAECDLGVDIPDKKDLIAIKAGGNSLEEIEQNVAKALGVSSITYSDRDSIRKALGRMDREMCWHCFGGDHPVDDHRRPVYQAEVKKSLMGQKVLFLASGSGTNVEQVLESMKAGRILAKPIGVITNNPEAGVQQRAAKFGVSTTIVASPKKFASKDERRAYLQEVVTTILNHPTGKPDVVVLAGWMLILGDEFITALTEANVMIINLHPALLSGKGQDEVPTSKGMVPEIRGAHAIDDAYAYPLKKMPVTGVSVHQVVAAGAVDTGRIIIKEEVARHKRESQGQLETRIHQAEYRVLSIALQRVLLERVVV